MVAAVNNEDSVVLAKVDRAKRPLGRSFRKDDIPRLREEWMVKIADLTGPIPLKLPPLREVNHSISLIDEKLVIRHHQSKCPKAYRPALQEKQKKYTKANWWSPTSTPSAAPLMVIPKKDPSQIRTVIDARQRNDNTVKDVTPFPDQDIIRQDIAKAKFRSKLDMSDAYEQIRIVPEDVWKTAFSTIDGTFVSNVLQQGDCNGPSTCQRLMVSIFRENIGIFVHVYLDDIFIFSQSIEEHERHLEWVFVKLRGASLYLSRKKVVLYAEEMMVLGHIVDLDGLHADKDKMERIREWRTPRNGHDIEKFLGLVQYIAQYMPNLSVYTSPLSMLTRKNMEFEWTPLHERCFNKIKELATEDEVLRPIDDRVKEPIWVVTDASVAGVGATYGQGPTWKTMRPAGFHSRKFNPAQSNYATHEQELLAVLEALYKWEDKLMGRRFTVVTDHRSLEFLKTQRRLSGRQIRWLDHLCKFDFDFKYVEGSENVVADALSRYHEFDKDDEVVPLHHYVNADERLEYDEEVVVATIAESRPKRVVKKTQKAQAVEEAAANRQRVKAGQDNRKKNPKVLKEVLEPRIVETEILNPSLAVEKGVEVAAESDKTPVLVVPERPDGSGPLSTLEEDTLFEQVFKELTAKDQLLSKIVASPKEFPGFTVVNKRVHTTNTFGREVLCLPDGIFRGRRVTEIIIDLGHSAIGHLGTRKTIEYIRHWVWWPKLNQNVEKFCISCGQCQMTKSSNQKAQGLLHTLPIPGKPWESVAMDFVGPLPLSEGYDYLMVVICRLTSMVHLVKTRTRASASETADLYY